MKYVIHHDADHDGLLSGLIACANACRASLSEVVFSPDGPRCFIARGFVKSKGYPGVEKRDISARTIGYDYGDALLEIHAIPDGADVVMLDISLPASEMLALANRCNLHWIDHHERTHSEVGPLLAEKARVDFGAGVAASRVAWGLFFPDIAEPIAVRCVGTYDVFDKSDPDFFENTALPFEYALRSEATVDIKAFAHAFSRLRRDNLGTAIPSGRAVLKYLRGQAHKIAQKCPVRAWLGLRAMFLANQEPGEHWTRTNAVFEKKPDVLVFFWFDVETEKWRVSVRQGCGDTPTDCAALCSKFGGGGHFNAAGFRTSSNLWYKL